MAEFLARMKQRKLVQWAIAYVAFAFALIQVLDVVAHQFGWPEVLQRGITLALVVGFFVVLVVAWYHGEKGRQRVSGAELLLIALVLAIGGGLLWRFAGSRQPAKAPPVGSVSASPISALAAAQIIPAKSVAVLPLVNESGDKDQQYFSDGLSEDLITALSQFAGLKVINRDSSFRFRDSKDSVQEIGEKLGVAHLLEGSVQRLGDEVRISAELVNCKDGSTLWSQHYDRPYKDLFALQDAITRAVTAALKARLIDTGGAVVQSDRPPSGNLAAWNDFQQGRFYDRPLTEAELRKAIGYFTDAVRVDPRYARAYVGLAFAWGNLAGFFLTPGKAARAWDKAHDAIHTALALDPQLAAAHAARAYILESANFDWTGAKAEARRAVQLAPHSASAKAQLASVLATLGHATQAVALSRQAAITNPLCAGCYLGMARYLSALGQFEQAAQAIHRAVQLQPDKAEFKYWLVYVDTLRGNAAAALQVARKLPPGVWRDGALALALQIGPNRATADAALKTAIAKYGGTAAYQIAEFHALRRDPNAMFEWLDRAWKNRDGGISFLLTDPPILRYRNDPRFAAFCKKVGLPTTTDAKAMR